MDIARVLLCCLISRFFFVLVRFSCFHRKLYLRIQYNVMWNFFIMHAFDNGSKRSQLQLQRMNHHSQNYTPIFTISIVKSLAIWIAWDVSATLMKVKMGKMTTQLKFALAVMIIERWIQRNLQFVSMAITFFIHFLLFLSLSLSLRNDSVIALE